MPEHSAGLCLAKQVLGVQLKEKINAAVFEARNGVYIVCKRDSVMKKTHDKEASVAELPAMINCAHKKGMHARPCSSEAEVRESVHAEGRERS